MTDTPAAPTPLAEKFWHGLLGTILSHGVLLESDERLVIYANEYFTHLFGIAVRPSALEGMSTARLVERNKGDFEDPEKFVAELEDQFRLSLPVRGYHLKMKDGRKLVRHYKPITLPDGRRGHLWEFEDVTQQLQMKATIQLADERLRCLIETVLDAIICLNIEGRVVDWNPAAERMFGWMKAEALGRPLTELIIPEEDHEAHRRGFARYLSSGRSEMVERRRTVLTALRREGSRFLVELSINVTGVGQDVLFVGFIRDISAQKAAEDSLRREVQFNSLMAQIALRMNASGPMDEVVFSSLRAIAQIHPELVLAFYTGKYDEQSFILEASYCPLGVPSLPERLPANDCGGFFTELARSWPDLTRYSARHCFPVDTEESSIGCLVVCGLEEAFPWSVPQFQGICASLSLGIKRLRKAHELRRLAAAINCGREGIAILDKQGRYVYMNPAHAKLFGYEDPGELLGHTWRTIYRPDAIREFETEVFPKLAKDGYWHGFPTGLRKDGTDIPEEVSLAVLPDGGTVCFCMDNSERLNAMESLRMANASLQRSARFKDQVLANMSHELRTPLNAVIGMAESLELHVYGELTPRQTRSVEVIIVSARHLLDLINDILDLAKIEAGKLEIQKQEINLSKLVKSTIPIFQENATAKRLRLCIHIPDDLPTLHSDERRLKQILINLLDNAIKFTPEGRAVGVEASFSKPSGQMSISVWDEGIGIALEHQNQLFRPFVQLDTGFARHYNGTGLGLALVHGLSQLLGGTVQLLSHKGKGSRFTLLFQQANAKEPASEIEPLLHHHFTPNPFHSGATEVRMCCWLMITRPMRKCSKHSC